MNSPPPYEQTVTEITPPSDPSPPNGDTQKAVITEMVDGQLEAGDSWFLVSRAWYRRWLTACSGMPEEKDDVLVSMEDVGPLDTQSLIDSATGSLRVPVTVGADCILLPAQAWGMLTAW